MIYWSSENALHEHFIAEQWRWVWMEMLQCTAQHFQYESSLIGDGAE